jgi:uncharacterized protein
MLTKMAVKVQPNAGRNEVTGLTNGVWKIKIAAPPDKGKANKELVDFLSDLLDIKKNQITILRGQASHDKVLAIEGLDEQAVAAKLGAK